MRQARWSSGRLIENPPSCRFDLASVQCKSSITEGCLTIPQIDAARKIYAGAENRRRGQSIFPGMVPGSELVWTALAGAKPFPIPVSHFRYVVFNDPNWDFRTLDFDTDVALADKLDAGLLNATDPNLKEFFGHGGKLIMYHGWNDELISPLNSIDYYGSVATKMGGVDKISDSFRLFMAPGMGHCSGGDGPPRINYVSSIEQWVEHGKAPNQLIAAHVTIGDHAERTRPLCPYPQIARYQARVAATMLPTSAAPHQGSRYSEALFSRFRQVRHEPAQPE